MAEASIKKRNIPALHDQEKLNRTAHVSTEHRQHNVSPSQKRTFLRWPQKGKEKSSVALACTWVVDHQIGNNPMPTPNTYLKF